MEFEVFKYLFSNNDEQRDNARNYVLESMKNPEFLTTLVQSLLTIVQNQSTENLNILQNICIVLHEEFKDKKKDNLFFSKEQIYFTYMSLFQVLFTIPYQIRHYIVDTFDAIFAYKIFNYFELVNQWLTILQQNPDPDDAATILDLLYCWSRRQPRDGKTREKFEHEEFTEKVIIILSPLLKEKFEFLASLSPELLQHIQDSQSPQFASLFHDGNELKVIIEKLRKIESNIQFIQYSTSLIELLIPMDKIYIEEFKEIMVTFSNILCLNIQGSNLMLRAKDSICDFFAKTNFMLRSPNNFSVSKRLYLQSFKIEIGPIIISSVLNAFQTCKNSSLLLSLLYVINVYLAEKLFLDAILNENFITQILIPATFLSEDDLLIFSEIPEQYIEFCMIFSKENFYKMSSVRQCICSIIKNSTIEFIELLFNFLLLPSSSPIEAEAKVFLQTAIFINHKISINLIQPTISSIKTQATEMPLFYYASLLSFLSAQEPNDDKYNDSNVVNDCIQIAVFTLLNFESPVVQIAACDLIDCCFDDKFKLHIQPNKNSIYENSIPIPQILTILLNLATRIQHALVGAVLEKFFDVFPNFFVSTAIEVICQFFQLWKISRYDQKDDQLASILVCISKIIMELPKNCETLYRLLEILTPEILICLQNDTNQNGFKQLIDILGCLSDEIDAPPAIFFDMIFSTIINVGFNQKFFESIENGLSSDSDDEENAKSIFNNVTSYIEDYTVVIFSLICRKNFFFIENNLNYVIKIIDCLFAIKCDNNGLNSSGFLITICLIQSAAVTAHALVENSIATFDPSQFIPLASTAAQLLKTFNDDFLKQKYYTELFVLAVAVISSVLIVNDQMAIQFLDQQVLGNWIKYHALCYHSSKIQFVHWSTIALLILSKYDLNQQGGLLFQVAVQQFLFMKSLENEDDYNDLHENDDDDDGYDDLDDNDDYLQFQISKFPFDNLTCDHEFNNIERNDIRLQFLTEKQLNLLCPYIKDNSY